MHYIFRGAKTANLSGSCTSASKQVGSGYRNDNSNNCHASDIHRFVTVKVALGATSKTVMVLLLGNGSIKKRDGWGRSRHAASIDKTHKKHSTLVLSTIA